jgi:hypothetical protein
VTFPLIAPCAKEISFIDSNRKQQIELLAFQLTGISLLWMVVSATCLSRSSRLRTKH